MRKLILATASVMALGIGGAAASHAADTGNPLPKAGLNAPAASHHAKPAVNLPKDDIRWAQLELRNKGLYKGSLDGVIGPETRQALEQYQRNNGLERTATLDQRTVDALLGNNGIGQGSSMPPKGNHGIDSAANPRPGQSE